LRQGRRSASARCPGGSGITGATYLVNHGILPLIDDRVSIAHNKGMMIDGRDVITGSFNFTGAAQERNAENVLLVKGAPVWGSAAGALLSFEWAPAAKG